MLVTYFSSNTGNTHRFVQKLDVPHQRIPISRSAAPLVVSEPHVLIVPTYGGGVRVTGENSRPVPKQVIQFLNNETNRGLLRGVIAAGNINFGPDFCLAGEVIAAKCHVPYLYRFELMGTPEDVDRVRSGLAEFEAALRKEGRWDQLTTPAAESPAVRNATHDAEKRPGHPAEKYPAHPTERATAMPSTAHTQTSISQSAIIAGAAS